MTFSNVTAPRILTRQQSSGMDLLLVFLVALGRFRVNVQAALTESQPTSIISEQLANDSAYAQSANPSGSTDSMRTMSSTTENEECLDEEVDVELRIIEEMLSSGYSKQLLPKKNGTDVLLEIHVSDIPHISEIGSFFELDMFYSEVWEDNRLAYGHRSLVTSSRCVKNMTLDLDYLQHIWTPNVCIVNSKSAVIHASPSENVFLILYPDGRMWKNCRMLVRAPCSIDLRNFPFDTQICSLLFESYSYNSQKVRLQWMQHLQAITLMKENMELADFILIQHQAEKLSVAYPNGHWDQLKATFVFERRYGFFIWQAFVPSYMTVGVAYITFWMDPKELCTRATLAISAFLAICLQFGNVQQNQPRVSYIKAMDVWMLASILFMFGALVELAIINYVSRKRERFFEARRKDASSSPAGSSMTRGAGVKASNRRRSTENGFEFEWQVLGDQAMPTRENGILSTSANSVRSLEENGTLRSKRPIATWWPMHMMGERRGRKKRKVPISADMIDKVFLCLYPPAFLAFNLLYWWYYLPHAIW